MTKRIVAVRLDSYNEGVTIIPLLDFILDNWHDEEMKDWLIGLKKGETVLAGFVNVDPVYEGETK